VGIYSCSSSFINTKKYLVDPQVGDIYSTRVASIDGSGYDDPSVFGFMKLIAIDGDVLTFVISKTANSRKHAIYYLVKKEYCDDAIHLSKSDIRRLYDEDNIIEIERK